MSVKQIPNSRSSERKIESAQGMLTERFAFCQTMPLDEFVQVAEVLRPSGYRPTRFRPYADARTVRVAAVWSRDGRPWLLAHDQPADAIRQADERNRKEQYLPVEVAAPEGIGVAVVGEVVGEDVVAGRQGGAQVFEHVGRLAPAVEADDTRSPGMARAVRATIGVRRPVPSSSRRTAAVVATPSSPGICTSIRIRS